MNSMLPIVDWAAADESVRRNALARPRRENGLEDQVADIVRRIRDGGDQALRQLTARLDGADLATARVDATEISAARFTNDRLADAIKHSSQRIRAFHQAQLPREVSVETAPGLMCQMLHRPIQRVGLYIPGGNAPLFSTLLMLAIPAQVAGVDSIAVVTPPNPDGSIHPAILATANALGIDEIHRAGGAQAIAALAFGTETIAPVNKIFGPGNAWVSAAKTQLAASGVCGVDLPAGPSEVMVVAGKTADPEAVAWDLLAQAEHDAQAQVLLVTDSTKFAQKVSRTINSLLPDLATARRARAALANARVLVATDADTAVEIINRYAPEHLILHDGDQYGTSQALLPRIVNAGSVFVGPWTPESLGDYSAGTNHVLPTGGAARFTGGVTTLSFMKSMTVQQATPAALETVGADAARMADAEGLPAHALAVRTRLRERVSA